MAQTLYSTSYCSSNYEITNNFIEKEDKTEYYNDTIDKNTYVAEIQPFDNNNKIFNYDDEYLKEILTNNIEVTAFSNDILQTFPDPGKLQEDYKLYFNFMNNLGTSSNTSEKTCCSFKKILDFILCKKKKHSADLDENNFYIYKLDEKELEKQIRKIVDDMKINDSSNHWFTNFYNKLKYCIKKLFCKSNKNNLENKIPLIEKSDINIRKNSLNLPSNTTEKMGNIDKPQRKMSADILNKILFEESSKYHIIDHSEQALYLPTLHKKYNNISYVESINDWNRKYSKNLVFENDQVKYDEDYQISIDSSSQSNNNI